MEPECYIIPRYPSRSLFSDRKQLLETYEHFSGYVLSACRPRHKYKQNRHWFLIKTAIGRKSVEEECKAIEEKAIAAILYYLRVV